jgi:hypothetical protein
MTLPKCYWQLCPAGTILNFHLWNANLQHEVFFCSSFDAVQSADFPGKKRVVKRSWGHSAGKSNVNYNETEEHKIKPHKLRNLRDHECVLVHCERGFRQATLLPLEADGTIAKWFSWWRRFLP